ncbi:hypothetical protein [Kutzneria sp. NPDC052558]|uniref:hypothetical protein n=1 Tax=Kutzneria sp. NPDC052558 TaxID=3364121 RepID=UPI0037CB9A87
MNPTVGADHASHATATSSPCCRMPAQHPTTTRAGLGVRVGGREQLGDLVVGRGRQPRDRPGPGRRPAELAGGGLHPAVLLAQYEIGPERAERGDQRGVAGDPDLPAVGQDVVGQHGDRVGPTTDQKPISRRQIGAQRAVRAVAHPTCVLAAGGGPRDQRVVTRKANDLGHRMRLSHSLIPAHNAHPHPLGHALLLLGAAMR